MQNKNLSKEAKLILDIARGIIKNKITPSINPDNLEKVNWPFFKELILYHGLAPFAYLYFYSYSSIPPRDLLDSLKKAHYSTLYRNMYFQSEFLRLNQVFTKENLTLVPIKGTALLIDIYKDYPIRPMIDIDALVKEEELEKAENILIKLGYNKYLEDCNE